MLINKSNVSKVVSVERISSLSTMKAQTFVITSANEGELSIYAFEIDNKGIKNMYNSIPDNMNGVEDDS